LGSAAELEQMRSEKQAQIDAAKSDNFKVREANEMFSKYVTNKDVTIP